METTDLVERVRARAEEMRDVDTLAHLSLHEAADTITALQARVEKLEGALKQLLAEARERGGMLSDGEVMGCAALAEGGPHE